MNEIQTNKKTTELLRMCNISKRFPEVQALEDVSLEVYSGEVLALMGERVEKTVIEGKL